MKYIIIILLILLILCNNKNKIEYFNGDYPENKKHKKPCPDNTFYSNNRCYKTCYDMGDAIGDVPCPYGQKNIGQLCYKACPTDYIAVNKKCCPICPSVGYRDRSDYCEIIME